MTRPKDMLLTRDNLPERITDIAALDEILCRPSQALIDDLRTVDGDIMILGIGGKMGPTLAGLAKNALPDRRIIGVARFSEPGVREWLQARGIELAPTSAEITYGLERIAMVLQRVDSVYDLEWASGVKYGEVRLREEIEQSRYVFNRDLALAPRRHLDLARARVVRTRPAGEITAGPHASVGSELDRLNVGFFRRHLALHESRTFAGLRVEPRDRAVAVEADERLTREIGIAVELDPGERQRIRHRAKSLRRSAGFRRIEAV